MDGKYIKLKLSLFDIKYMPKWIHASTDSFKSMGYLTEQVENEKRRVKLLTVLTYVPTCKSTI